MSAQDIIGNARIAHVRELKTEVARLKADNAALRDELSALRAHFDLAVLAASDLKGLPEGAHYVVIDGWNLILGAQKEAVSPEDLEAQARRHLEAHPQDFVWIVFDGPHENVRCTDRLRISYTGGTGAHRADKFICDFLRMARFCGLRDRVEVRTNDKDFLREANRI